MSLKDTILMWNNGAEKAVKGRHEEAIDIWTEMPEPGARIYFSIASMFIKLGNLEDAERNLDLAVKKDPHFAIAFFQRGCVHLQKKRYKEAMGDFDIAMKTFRGNTLIDYKQLGLQYKIYACEVMYNRANAYMCMGKASEAREELEKAKELSAITSESRHKIITDALDSVRLGTKFLPYKLPDKALVFQPPRSKTAVLKDVNFLGEAKVLSSVVDNDSYTGFVGVQEAKSRQRSPSPLPKRPVSPQRSDISKAPKKPDIPPPMPNMKIPRRNSSLHENEKPSRKNLQESDEFKKVVVQSQVKRPPKPDVAPPPFHPDGNIRKGLKTPVKPSDLRGPPKKTRPANSGLMTVKVHYTTTRAIRLNTSTNFAQLQQAICKKFDCQEYSLTLWSKKRTGDLKEITDEVSFKDVISSLEDGFRLTLWAYDKHESSPEVEDEVLKEVVAIYDYNGNYEDELSFNAGDVIQVIVDINDSWYEGRCLNNSGIFPKTYVKDV